MIVKKEPIVFEMEHLHLETDYGSSPNKDSKDLQRFKIADVDDEVIQMIDHLRVQNVSLELIHDFERFVRFVNGRRFNMKISLDLEFVE